MADAIFESAAERIAFSEAVDFIDQGRTQLIAPQLLQQYIGRGLLQRRGDALEVTTLGREQHRIAQRERFSDG